MINAIKQNYRILANKLDARENFKQKLIAYYDRHGEVPVEHRHTLKEYLAESKVPWRARMFVKIKMVFAAFIMAVKNSDSRRIQ